MPAKQRGWPIGVLALGNERNGFTDTPVTFEHSSGTVVSAAETFIATEHDMINARTEQIKYSMLTSAMSSRIAHAVGLSCVSTRAKNAL